MNKRLNPGLFDEGANEKVQGLTTSPVSYTPQSQPQPRVEAEKIFEEIQMLKLKMRGYESQLELFKNQMSDFVRNIDQRFDRMSQALSRLEKAVHTQGRETDTKMQAFREKIQNQNFEEAKIEGLVERQTVVIRNFENRLTAMQKIINEKEVLLMKYFEALKAAQPPLKR